MAVDRALADTSLLVARERERSVEAHPEELAVSIVTLAELRLGVLTAEGGTRARRLRTLIEAERLAPLPVDRLVAQAWAELVRSLRAAGRRMPVNDSWIAATAIAHRLPLVTRDADYDRVPGLDVIRA
ncbi:MAG: PIN domain-containing protein [Candidatus Dormibacteraceae bacterium]